MMRFAHPFLLLLLLLIPGLLFMRRRQCPATVAYPSLHDLVALPLSSQPGCAVSCFRAACVGIGAGHRSPGSPPERSRSHQGL